MMMLLAEIAIVIEIMINVTVPNIFSQRTMKKIPGILGFPFSPIIKEFPPI